MQFWKHCQQTEGVCSGHSHYIYSHIGHGSGNYGAPITLDHRSAIAFTVEMDHAMMGLSPDAPVVMESARQYVEAAKIALQLGYLIRSLGYPARAHIDEANAARGGWFEVTKVL